MKAALLFVLAASVGGSAGPVPPARVVDIAVDTRKVLHRINPEIYGASFADAATLHDLNLPLDRSGGNSATLYDWRSDARNAGSDFYFESLPAGPGITDQFQHGFVAQAHAGGARSILTIPAIGWTARLGPGRSKLAGFSVAKYGRQQGADTQWFPDAGNGKHPDGTPITVNDPQDAARRVDIAAEATARVADLVARWGPAKAGGVPYYAIDNEPGLWHESQREVQKDGVHAVDLAARAIAVARAIKAADPTAKVIAPEAWGWPEYFDSGYDVQGRALGRPRAQSDRALQTGGMDQLPWLLERWRAAKLGGHLPVDIVSVHFYPQGGEYNDGSAGSRAVQLLRNRSTRALWDANYRDASWIDAAVGLIPRLRGWVDAHYARGVPIAITEYNWGGENSMSGATAQADIWGLFGRYGLNMGVRWAVPARGTPTYKMMKLIRDPDGRSGSSDRRAGVSRRGDAFGSCALGVRVPDPDTLSAFAAKTEDGRFTVLVVNKSLDQEADVRMTLQGAPRRISTATAYRLAAGQLASPTRVPVSGGVLNDRMPAQSIALYVVPARGL